jgi:hypothetical protein
MQNSTTKGQRRIMLDIMRVVKGEPQANWEHNTTLHSKYEAGSAASRNKGKARFHTGKKSKK